MPLYNAGREAAVDGVVERTARASLHTADPGSAGTANEVAGGGYARQNTTAATDTTDDGVRDVSVARFTGLTNVTITHYVIWDASGAPLGSGMLDAPQSFTTAGDYDLVVRATSPA